MSDSPARLQADQRLGQPGAPAVVAIGGGHGLARSLGAARRFAGAITALVSVADDGGSSGRLREAFDIPAPGDLRRAITALLPGPSALGDSLEYRFVGGELDGHALGNLLIAALTATTGSFVCGVQELCALLATVGDVVPATSGPVVLGAETAIEVLKGQLRITQTGGVLRLFCDPSDIDVPEQAVAALAGADAIIIGPGSLYTSVLAAVVPSAITKALAGATGRKIYVCNLREQLPETAGYDAAAHVAALISHGVLPDVVLVDPSEMPIGALAAGVELATASLSRSGRPVHSEELLAGALLEILGLDS